MSIGFWVYRVPVVTARPGRHAGDVPLHVEPRHAKQPGPPNSWHGADPFAIRVSGQL